MTDSGDDRGGLRGSGSAETARERGELLLAQSEGFVRNKLWEEAIRALEQADSLLPNDLRVVSALASAHRGRFADLGEAADRARLRALAGRCLELDPRHEPAFKWIKEVEAFSDAERQKHRGRMIVGAAAIGVAVLGIAAVKVLGGGGGGPRVDVSQPTAVAVESTPPARAIEGLPACPNASSYCTLDAGISIAAGAAGDTKVELVPASLEVTPNGEKLEIAGRITQNGATELGLLTFAVVLLDEHENEVGRQSVVAHAEYEPPLRRGESDTFYQSAEVPPATRAALLESATRDEQPGATEYGDLGEYSVTYDPPAPAHFRIGVVKRTHHAQLLGDHTSIETIVSVENRGESVIRSLEFELRTFDATGKQLEARKETIAWSHMPPMQPKERRVDKISVWSPGNPARESIVVTKIE